MRAEVAGTGLRRLALWSSIGALGASGGHVVIDFLVGVYPWTALGLILVGLPASAVYGVWALALSRAAGGSGGGLRAARILALVQAALINGLVGLFPCPPTALVGGPPSCPLSPWQDLAHLGSLIFGALAFWSLARIPTPFPDRDSRLPGLVVGLLVGHVVLGGVVFVVGS